MVDYELFKKILSDNDGYIQPNDFIDDRTMQLFADSNTDKVKNLFLKSGEHVTEFNRYFIEVKCPDCSTFRKVEYTKSKFLKYLSFLKNPNKRSVEKKDYLCPDCLQKSYEDERKAKEEKKLAHLKEVEENTEKYIKDYLNPHKRWRKGMKLWWKMNELDVPVYSDVIAEYIVKMDYKDFLNTKYWKAIAEKVKRRAGDKCNVCNSTENLNVHHRTYEHHGYELYNLKDLVCLCKECHEKYHFE